LHERGIFFLLISTAVAVGEDKGDKEWWIRWRGRRISGGARDVAAAARETEMMRSEWRWEDVFL
jgi:hypothetical protein